ncbi:DEAD/DEAH box helicase [Halanaerobacter jeridensis]|uniref:Superfamily II DNA or RNA helicase n=1 Tax=Halanaerobacter jeridensis TaxID=706427 RepID=A0A938XV94_9FIRM|nr:DEAD/DEAH box helicase family protein [Halanaerobacter jeridensis]MBM7558160.1 superfamily II DNA or RNA helicase [Halanaerobacter jeridensis]
MKSKKLVLPPIYKINCKVCNDNVIKQLVLPSKKGDFKLEKYEQNRVKGYILKEDNILIIENSAQIPDGFNKVLRLKGDNKLNVQSNLIWEKHPKMNFGEKVDFDFNVKETKKSWRNSFSFKKEIRNEENEIVQSGLRPPQIGAIHSMMSHSIVSDKPATIVMPTGTGKTETMLGLLIAKECDKVLVIVPRSTLRKQISDKFISLGILKKFGIVKEKVKYPVVGILKHKLNTIEEANQFFKSCNVIVSTMRLINICNTRVQEKISEQCSHLFIDEAHHIGAPTWRKFRNNFSNKQIIQFTATPFRNDGKNIDGEIIFNYPLHQAQKEGYFKKINFEPIVEFTISSADKAIAEKAVEQLKEDISNGFEHILMARVKTIKRVKEVFSLYESYEKFNPVFVHSNLNKTEKEKVFSKIKAKESKIVVCVDMFGEGFDLPELKIAALHDIHKSLGVTLQFTGRFTRTKSNIGEATFIANIADPDVNDTLQKLYSEDADWNFILKDNSNKKINDKIKLSNLIDGFTKNKIDEISIQNISIAMSTVVYESSSNTWDPENFTEAFYKNSEIIHTINHEKNILIIIKKNYNSVPWGKVKKISNISWDLYVAYWNADQNLLFINSTASGGSQKLADSIIQDYNIISGEKVFRCFDGINRIILQNVGLSNAINGPVRFRMYAGTDIVEGLSDAQKRNTIKSNIFGLGYENGQKTSIGCSYKGKIWSKKRVDLLEWCNWCGLVGEKLKNDQIDIDDLINGVLKPEVIEERPNLMPVGIEWPESFLIEYQTTINIIFDESDYPLYETSIELIDRDTKGNLKFKIFSEDFAEFFELVFDKSVEGNYYYKRSGNISTKIKTGNETNELTEWFKNNEPPVIRFADGSYLQGNIYVKPEDENYSPFNKEKIKVWNWDGVDIKKESQNEEKKEDSIQYNVIQKLMQRDYNLIIDDAGEAADIVTFKVDEESKSIGVEFYHCKYSHGEKPGYRINDLYDVCGQTQKSIYWKQDILVLINHIKKREEKRINENRVSRFEKGSLEKLLKIKRMSKFYSYNLDIYIVQPGLSKCKVSNDQLELLGATENYLKETYDINLSIIASE